jgi:hypothetical protein
MAAARTAALALGLVAGGATAPAAAADAPSAAGSAAAAGRWEGSLDIPGAPQPVVVDLAPDAQGSWQGSIVLPGYGIRCAPLDALAVGEHSVAFAFGTAFPIPDDPAPRMTLAPQADGTLAGTLEMGGNSTAVRLHRTGAAQVDVPAVTKVISAALAGVWHGRYELGGYPREVTLTLANRPAQAAGGQLVVVGKRTTTLEVDRIMQGQHFVALHSSAADFGIEGRFDAETGTIAGSMSQGPFEAPIVLHRDAVAKEGAS